MTQETNAPEGSMAASEPLRPGEARVWLELGEGSDPVTALEAVLADCKERQAEVQGYGFWWYPYQMVGRDGKLMTWEVTQDANGNIIHLQLPNPPQPAYHGVDRQGNIITYPGHP